MCVSDRDPLIPLLMADSTPTPTNHTHAVAESSSFQRTVCLYDWWLIKAENDSQGKRLAVAGISSRKEEAVRVFVSAPVIKRFDVFSLETADGIYIILKGFINEQRTLQNGFPSEVFNSFIFGFPPNWENFAVDFFREESTTGIDSGNAVPSDVDVSEVGPEILSDGGEKSSPTCLVSPEEAPGGQEKVLPKDECNASKEMGGVNAASGNDHSRRSARLRSIKICQQKKPASGGPLRHPNKGQSSTLENPDAQAPKSPVTPVQSRSQRQVNTSSERIVRKSASRISRTLSANTEGYKKKKVTVSGSAVKKTKMSSPERKTTKFGSAVKHPRERDASPTIKGGKEIMSPVSPESLSFRKSRSGRLLLPPLEFWRNQIPVYNADHEIMEIQEGASLVSPCRGSSPLLSRFKC